MKRTLILVAISLFLCSTASSFQGGGGESTKKGSSKKAVTKKKTSGATPTNTIPPRPRARLGQGGIEFVLIPAGEFMMGSMNGYGGEKPVHRVALSQPFYMGKFEVTQGQWQSVMGNNPSNFKNCDNCPVEQVSWEDAQRFINKLNATKDGYTYRLPSEAEWEYGCRAGTTGDYAGDLDPMAWYGSNSGNARLDADAIWRDDRGNYSNRVRDNGNKTHPVGTKQANAFGLYDMHGNVSEWCEDWYHDYDGAPTDGSAWLSGGEQKYRVLRGGSWYLRAFYARSASRFRAPPDNRDFDLGFRVYTLIGAGALFLVNSLIMVCRSSETNLLDFIKRTRT